MPDVWLRDMGNVEAAPEGERMNERGYQWIKNLKEQTGKNIPDLLALSRVNDPFFTGTKTHERQAQWFAKMWKQKYEGQTGIHIRRVHYLLQSKPYPKLNGKPYTNCKADWKELLECSRVARLLGLVPVEAFEDRRNPDPYPLNWRMAEVRSPQVFAPYFFWGLPSLRFEDLSALHWSMDVPRVEGYEPDDYLDRAYLIEVWIEKSTMDDILLPLSRDMGFRLVPSTGYQSISNAIKLLKRVRETGKLARIFYISDYDKAGRIMPIAVARQVEYWLDAASPEIKLHVLALTEKQIAEHHLPYSVDEKHRVELDALEAIAPGQLATIVRHAIQPYLDETIHAQLAEAKREAQQTIDENWAATMKPHRRELKALQKKVRSVTKRYQRKAAVLNKQMARALKPFQKPLATLRAKAQKQAANFRPELPERPKQRETFRECESDYLFDSLRARDYFAQLAFYKRQRA